MSNGGRMSALGSWPGARSAKFQSSPELSDYLGGAGDGVLVEASPTDLIWGIGLAADDEAAALPSRWPGQNLSVSLSCRPERS